MGDRRFHGVDFSGARDAGRKIWIATGTRADGQFRIEEVRRGESLSGSGRSPDECLPALRRFIAERPGDVFGCDFPFGVPRALLADQTWEEFAAGFGARYADATAFREACRRATGGRELRRRTDREARVPFAAYNARIYRQTFHGIRDLLAPLAREGSASIVPMQPLRPGTAIVCEICPASTLKRDRRYWSYKGRTPERRAARERILAAYEAAGDVTVEAEARAALLDDPGGDALDGVIAALTAARVWAAGFRLPDDARLDAALEGWVYV